VVKRIGVCLALLLPLFAQGAGLPSPDSSQTVLQGTIDAVNESRLRITIGDQVFRYTNETMIHRAGGGRASTRDLRLGQRVGYKVADGGPPFVLTDIWLRPQGADFSR